MSVKNHRSFACPTNVLFKTMNLSCKFGSLKSTEIFSQKISFHLLELLFNQYPNSFDHEFDVGKTIGW